MLQMFVNVRVYVNFEFCCYVLVYDWDCDLMFNFSVVVDVVVWVVDLVEGVEGKGYMVLNFFEIVFD